MLRKKFDLVVSLGEACGCALYMKKFKLRDHSYPFDWLYDATFEKRIELIARDFEGFLEKENMEQFTNEAGGDLYHDFYVDLNTGFRFLHDFPKDMPLEESYDAVYEKYKRRISRLYEMATKSENILFIWFGLRSILPTEAVLEAQRILSAKFNKDVHLLVFEHDGNLSEMREEKLNGFATKAIGPITDDKDYVYGRKDLVEAVFSRVKGRKKYGYVLLRVLMRLCCCFVPSSKLRRKIRSTYEGKW